MSDFICSADSHIIEPTDLWKQRLPKQFRDRAIFVEHFDDRHQDVTGPDGMRYTVGRFRHVDTQREATDLMDNSVDDQQATIERRIADMDADGIWAEVVYPNYGMFMFVEDHELAMADARVHNDYVAETFGSHLHRSMPLPAIPLTDIDDAVAEIERVAGMGLRGIHVPTQPGGSYATRKYDRVWAAAEANEMPVAFHVGTGFASAQDPVGATFKDGIEGGVMAMLGASAGVEADENTPDPLAMRLSQSNFGAMAAQNVIAALVGSGVCERFPNLHLIATEFNAHWLASFMGAVDKSVTLGIGQDPTWDAGQWQHDHSADDQPFMINAFEFNEAWPYPLRPSDYIRRQIHCTFMDDPAAVALRHYTGVEAILWGNDYPHAEGTYPRTRELLAQLFDGVPAAERAAMTGGTLAALFKFEQPALASA